MLASREGDTKMRNVQVEGPALPMVREQPRCSRSWLRLSMWGQKKKRLSERNRMNAMAGEMETGRKAVRGLLATLAPPERRQADRPTSDDLTAVTKAVGVLSEAAEKRILTEEEARAVVEAIVRRFVERRFTKVIEEVFTPSKSGWFIVASGKSYGQTRILNW